MASILAGHALHEWFDVGQQFYELQLLGDDELAGLLLELDSGELFLIGHVNPRGGSCDCCCDLSSDSVVRRAKRVWDGSQLPAGEGIALYAATET